MLGDNIKVLRKQKGYSQETLAEQLNVVRQTISKWEKGYSVPDAEMLERIASLFEVSVSELLGSSVSGKETEFNEIANQLAILNEHLAKQARTRKKISKIVLVIFVAIVIIPIVIYIALFCLFSFSKTTKAAQMTTTVELQCTLDGEEYLYGITYDDQYNVISAGGDAWIADHVQTEKYGDANILIAQIEDYFTLRGGTCEVINCGTDGSE